MSRFLSEKYRSLETYTPGEQPREQKLIKLNTNENPYPPGAWVAEAVRQESEQLRLYSDPESLLLRRKLAEVLTRETGGGTEIRAENLIMTNGSDEALNYAFMAWGDEEHPAVFPDITYGFYPVFARVNRIPFRTVPLDADFRIRPADYAHAGGPIFLANPNAPTGLLLKTEEIEAILRSNPDSPVIVDEAYIDFGGESAMKLIGTYGNLLIIRTFSKSRSLAGLRLGFAAGSAEMIADLKTMQYATNPYNVDRLAQAAGIACLEKDEYNRENARRIAETREWTKVRMTEMGFDTTESKANFLFARHPAFPGSSMRDRLREKGILIRWFDQNRIRDWSRISVGTREEMETLIETLDEMIRAAKKD